MGRNRKKSNNKMRIQEFFIVCIFLCITSQLLASGTVENEEEEVVKRHWNYHPSHWGSWGRGGHWGHGGRWGGRGRWGGGRWGKRDVESQEIESTNDAGNEVAKDQAKRWYGVGMGYHPYAYSPYGYGYWGKRDVEAQQETEKTRRKRDVEGQEIETTEKDENAGQEVTKDQAKETSKAKKSSQPMMQAMRSLKIKQRDGTELAWVIIRTLTAHTAMAIGVNVTLKLNKKLKRQEEREMLKVRKSRQPRKIGTQAKKSQKIKQRDGTVMDMVDTV